MVSTSILLRHKTRDHFSLLKATETRSIHMNINICFIDFIKTSEIIIVLIKFIEY